jgi:hypothetical protein
MEPSAFHCSAEWHLARLGSYAAVIYPLALHLSNKSGIFSASIPTLAAYFQADERSIRKAIRQLADLGFFEIDTAERGASKRYQVVRHKEWSAKHPGHCTEKETMPWSDEPGDTLGVELSAITGGRFKPYPNFVKGIRKTGHSEAAIREHLRCFVRQYQPVGRQWSHGFAGFIKYLKSQPCAAQAAAQAQPCRDRG